MTKGIQFALADDRDEEDLRQLLREIPMGSDMSLSLEREPYYFAGDPLWEKSFTVIAREELAPFRPVGFYRGDLGTVYINGQPRSAGYLGGLRIHKEFRHRRRILRAGYDSIRRLVPWDSGRIWFTSIASDNYVARRILEKGLPGLPRYEFVAELKTYVFSTRLSRSKGLWRTVDPGAVPEALAFVNAHNQRFQFSPVVRMEKNFHVYAKGSRIMAAMSLWDQRSFKQVVVRGYSNKLRWMRPAINTAHRLMQKPLLPSAGQKIEGAFISYLTVSPEVEGMAGDLVRDALFILKNAGGSLGYLGLSPQNHLRTPLEKLPHVSYLTRIETVTWPDSIPTRLDGRPIQPEIAFL